MKKFVCVFLMLSAMGCSVEADNDDSIGQQIADDYNGAMDKARNVEAEIMEAQQEIDDALDAQDP